MCMLSYFFYPKLSFNVLHLILLMFFIFKGPVRTTWIKPLLLAQYPKRSQMQRLMWSWIYLMPLVKKMLVVPV